MRIRLNLPDRGAMQVEILRLGANPMAQGTTSTWIEKVSGRIGVMTQQG
ncbi:hypothetical protein PROFUN_06052 [Planoprotostelium fungivorum]|uniref:Uncharacterized protein n=1 Tax=Planoprotostelium fungivorum TaxID=1890364 RepID=A0A2P6NPP4_9EUKA|nr:hypothetical protein PROFUN_06052 [Planoprotostelium fungivorum]